MVGRQHDHDRVRVALDEKSGGESDCRRSVPADRLKYDVPAVETHPAQLAGEALRRDEELPPFRTQPGNPLARLLGKRLAAEETDELLGPVTPAPRPEALAPAAAQNHRVETIHGSS
jgi:hypothetical protein